MAVLVLDGCGGESDDTGRSEPSSPITDTSTAPPVHELTGYAATEQAWLSAHERAEGYAEGAAFGPLVERDGQTLPRYGGVSLETPVVIYSINLPEGTTLREAKQVALDEFPPGARFGIFDDEEARCLIATVRSKPAEQAMRQHGYAEYVPVVAFSSENPSDVIDIQFLFGESNLDLGRC